jgi:hypothetical protein
MKRISSGAVYDTETSKELGSWKHGKSSEALYITKSGKYFLYCEDGSILKLMITREDGTWAKGIDILPLTIEKAMMWAKEKLSYNEYSTIFGEQNNLDEKVTLNLTVSIGCKTKLERARSETGKSISQIVSELVMSNF